MCTALATAMIIYKMSDDARAQCLGEHGSDCTPHPFTLFLLLAGKVRLISTSWQALICTALGLPPTFFRRLVQSNGATSVLDFMPPRGGSAPSLVVDRLNQVQP